MARHPSQAEEVVNQLLHALRTRPHTLEVSCPLFVEVAGVVFQQRLAEAVDADSRTAFPLGIGKFNDVRVPVDDDGGIGGRCRNTSVSHGAVHRLDDGQSEPQHRAHPLHPIGRRSLDLENRMVNGVDRSEDQLDVDRFYRYNESLQEFLAAVETQFVES